MHKSLTSTSTCHSLLQILLLIMLMLCKQSLTFSLSPVQKNRLVIGEHRIQVNYNTTLTLFTYPETLYNINEGEVGEIRFDYDFESTTAIYANDSQELTANFILSDEFVANLNTTTFTFVPTIYATKHGIKANSSSNETLNRMRYSLFVTGKFLGRVQIQLNFRKSDNSDKDGQEGKADDGDDGGDMNENDFKYRISVIRKPRIIDMVFRSIIWLFVIFANTGMGCEIDLNVVKQVLRRPLAPIIGFVSQYLFMPMISFGMLQLISLPGSTALGYFGMGCAPGGGASNFYCLLLAGDVSLSITMTLISTLGAFGMTPLYMFTLGQLILQQRDVKINIPYLNIVFTLLLILIPSIAGYVLQLKLPKVARIYRKILKPVILIFVIFMFTFGVYANLFIWRLFSPPMILAGCALPYAGFILGGLTAFIFRQPWNRIKTISLETGIQNPGVPILLLQTSLPQPDADLSLVGPIAAATFTPFPLFIWVAVRMIYYKCYLKESPFQHTDKFGKHQNKEKKDEQQMEGDQIQDKEEVDAFIEKK